MASFYVELLFTNITLQETIDLSVDVLFNDQPNIDGFTKTDFHELLTIIFSESLVLSYNEYYKQINRVAMGSPLGSIFANIFLSYYEQMWLKNCPCEFKPVMYKRYVDDTFLLFRSKDHIEKFQGYLNCEHPNKFTSEIEENNSISFLDIKVSRVNNSFSANIYRKVTFNGAFSNFESFIPISYNSNSILTLLFRAFKLCFNFELFYQEILNLKYIFKINGYPGNRYYRQIFEPYFHR